MSWVDDAVAAERPGWRSCSSSSSRRDDEEAGQAVMARAFADCGLEPVDVPLDAEAMRADPHHSPFSWSVEGKRNVVATWHGTAAAAR